MNDLIEGKDYSVVDGILTINEGIIYIPENKFRGRDDILSVIFPSTLLSIKSGAFACCSLEGTITIPDSVKYVHDFTFNNNNINKVIIGTDVAYIGEYAFYSNPIWSVTNKSDKLIEVEKFAFGAYQNFSPVPMSKTCVSCGSNDKDRYTYKNYVLKIHDGVELIGDFSSLERCVRVEMPDSVSIIGSYAFKDLKRLRSIRFSNNLLDISNKAFVGCESLSQKMIFPESLCYIESDAFDGTYLKDKISVSYNTYINVRENYERRRFEVRDYIIDDINCDKLNYAFDLSKLLNEEKELLEKLNLLPDQIEKNSSLNGSITQKQSIIMKKALIDFIISGEYNEKENIFYIKELLKLKEIDVRDMHEVINYLFEKKQLKTIYLLMSYGYNYLFNCMISRAIINGLSDMVDVLLILGADINETGAINMTPLSLACQKGDTILAKHLIEKGAAINIVDKDNKTAIDYAVENNHQDIVKLINSYNNEKSDIESDLETIKKHLVLGE